MARVAEGAAESRIDAALIARVRLHDDRGAFEQLVRRHQGMVRAQLRRLAQGDAAAADDLAQETFLLAWRKLDQFRGDATFSTWLYRIAYSCFLQAHRKAAREVTENGDGEMERLPATEPARDLQLDFARALQRLSAAEQAVLLHCVQMGLSHEEAAYVLAMPLGTVKTHASRAKAKLKRWLAAWRTGHGEE